MSVHYKFKSALEYDTVAFDGLHISVKDLKNAIIQQKRIGKSTDFDLQVTNAQTKEVYNDENALIPKNTSLLIARIPNAAQSKPKQWDGYGGDSSPTVKTDDGGPIAKATDLSVLDAPEDDKIKAMMSQSTQDYDPSNYQKIRGANQMGAVPPTYRCYKCHQTGHWIKDCTFAQGADAVDIKKSTGIPQSFMVPVEGPQVPGAMMTPNGCFAVPVLDHQAYNFKQAPAAIEEQKPDIPEDLICSICSDLLADAVMIPCCGNSFCDECIRFFLLESEEHECPDCHEKDISPGTLIPNRFLRKSVANFKNTTGYVKKPIFRPQPSPKTVAPVDTASKDQKTVISEADSTEQSKTKEVDREEESKVETKQGDSPKVAQIKHVESNVESKSRGGNKDYSPRRARKSSPPTLEPASRSSEDRPGTPTVDEPGVGVNAYQYSTGAPPNIGGMMPLPPNVPGMEPAPAFGPPFTGGPPNFRLPPPGSVPPPYLPPGSYANPPRPLFDPTRPPMTGGPPPGPFGPGFPRPSHHHREYDRRMRNRTPPGVIDDPLAAFNRMIREKDERERRAKQRMAQRRTYSRSRSRSRSYSPRSPRRMRSRSPRRRSRSRSFSVSRSRSRSYSGGSPPPYRDRDYSPSRRGPPSHSRYRSSPPPPARSPPRRYKDHASDRRDRDDYDRDYYRREERDYSSSRRHERGGYRSNFNNFDDRYGASKGQWNDPMAIRGPHEQFYNPPPPEIGQAPVYPPPNRYPMVRDYAMMPAQPILQRKYDDIAPPGVEEPPVPGLENSPHEEKIPKIEEEQTKDEKRIHKSDKDKDKHRSDKDGRKDRKETDRKRRHRSGTPSKKRSRSKDRDKDNVEKRKKKEEVSDREKSDDDKIKKTRDKKKKKEKDKKEKEKKKRDKKDRHKEKKQKDDNENAEEKKTQVVEEPKQEGALVVDNSAKEVKGDSVELKTPTDVKPIEHEEPKAIEEQPAVAEFEESEKDILEIHSNDIELDAKNDMFLPERSKWDDDDEFLPSSPKERRNDERSHKSGSVSNDVLKRAENAIFAKAINSIKPIEIRKISTERTKLYANENKEAEKKVEAAPPVKLSIKDRLGVKVDEPDDNRRAVELDEKRAWRDSDRKYQSRREREKERERKSEEASQRRRDEKRRSRSKTKPKEVEKRRSRSKSDDKKRKRDKKEKDKQPNKEERIDLLKAAIISKRKSIFDEANFVPDYDLESEKEDESSSDSESSSSSEEERRKRKKRKHRKKKYRRDSSSSSSESESESSEDERDKKRKKKKKSKKKKKKSKHR